MLIALWYSAPIHFFNKMYFTMNHLNFTAEDSAGKK